MRSLRMLLGGVAEDVTGTAAHRCSLLESEGNRAVAESKKHHHVPQFLLRNFANADGQLFVHRAGERRQYTANVGDIGHKNFGHSLYWPDRDPDHVSLEVKMSDIEGAAAAVVAELRKSRARSVASDQREVLSFLIALQWARSRFLLDVIRREVQPSPDMPEQILNLPGLLNIVRSVLHPWEARQEDVFDPKERFCTIESVLAQWHWRLYRPTGPKLVIGDNLVAMSGVAPGSTSDMPEIWSRHGVGVGFGTCARVTVPLAPEVGLVLTSPTATPGQVTAADFNRATILNCREFVAYHPDGLPDSRLRAAFEDDLARQRYILPAILKFTVLHRR